MRKIFARAILMALIAVFYVQGDMEAVDETAGTLDMAQFQPLEDEVLDRLLEKDDGPLERKIKRLVAQFLLATAIDEVNGTHTEENGRALLQGNYYPQAPPPQQPQVVYVYGTPPPAATQRTRRTRRPGHHHHHHRESSEERTTQPPRTIVQPIYIPQQPQYPQQNYPQPPYNPQYQPQPPYNPQYPPQQQPPYQPQPVYQPAPPQQPQPAYQPVPQQPPPAYQPPPQNQRPASVDLPQDSLGGQVVEGEKPSSSSNATTQPTPTTIAPAQTPRPQQAIHMQFPSLPAAPAPAQPYPPQSSQPYPPQSSQPYPAAPAQPQQPYPYPPQQTFQPQAPPPPVQVIYIEPTLAPGQTTTTGPTTTPRPTPSQEHVYNQVNKILDNVGTLNVPGIVDSALGIRTPAPTRNFVNGILNTVFCNPINRLLGRCRG